jgi:4-amino-4-deoxy-L-arabinose transferase-like glycosyltransferase
MAQIYAGLREFDSMLSSLLHQSLQNMPASIVLLPLFLLYQSLQNMPTHAVLLLMAGLSAILALFCLDRYQARPEAVDLVDLTAVPEHAAIPRIRLPWLGLSIALSLYTTWRTVYYPAGAYAGEYLIAWGLAMFALVRAVAKPRQPDEKALHHREILFLMGLTLAALSIRVIQINTVPYILDQDEARFGLNGVGVREAQFMISPFIPGDHTHPYLNYILTGVTTSLWGDTLAGARLPSVVFGTLSIPVIYLLGRELLGWQGGLIAALFALGWAFQVQFSRLALNQAGDALFVMLPFYFLLRGMRRASAVDYVLSGITLGVAQLFYAGGRLAPLIMLAFVIWLLMMQRRLILRQWRLFAILILALIVVALPQHYYLLHFQKPITDRAAPNIFIGGSYQQALEQGINPAQYLLTQTQRAYMGLFLAADLGGWYGPGSSIMGPFGSPPLLIGVFASLLLCWRRPRLALPLGWSLAVIVALSVLSAAPPQYQRFFPASAALALLVAMGVLPVVDKITDILGRPGLRNMLIIGVSALFVLANLAFYVGSYVPARKYIANRANWATNLTAQAMVAAYNAGEQVMLMTIFRTGVENTGVVKYFMAGHPYSLVENEKALADQLDMLRQVDTRQPFAFVIAPPRADDLKLLQKLYPGGIAREVKLEEDGTTAFYVYESRTGIPLPPPETISGK